MTKAILVGGLLVAVQAAAADTSAFPGESDDAGYNLPAKTMHERAGNSGASAVSAFPGASDDAGYQLPAKDTYADHHGADRLTGTGSAFPHAADDAPGNSAD
jgi:hypothetical protein